MKAYELGDSSTRILYVDGTAEHRVLEGWGVELINYMAARLRDAIRSSDQRGHFLPLSHNAPIPEGPEFTYDFSPDVFLNRRGSGPLYVAWDTNLLIDYFQYGALLWRGGDLPDSLGEDYQGELEGLQFLLSLWAIRDIRFVILPLSIIDAKRKLGPQRRLERIRAFNEFIAALRLIVWDPDGMEQPSRDGVLILPDSLLEEALESVPAGFDRDLVRAATKYGAHVFLTRDGGIQRSRPALRRFGLSVASPLDLLEWLLAGGAYHCFLEPRCAYWPLPDQQRVSHLIRALPMWE